MRTAIVAILLLGAAGTTSPGAARQDEPPMVFQRVCNIEPGRETPPRPSRGRWSSWWEASTPGSRCRRGPAAG